MARAELENVKGDIQIMIDSYDEIKAENERLA